MVSSTLLTMKHGEIACVVGRVIGVNLRCGSIKAYQRGMTDGVRSGGTGTNTGKPRNSGCNLFAPVFVQRCPPKKRYYPHQSTHCTGHKRPCPPPEPGPEYGNSEQDSLCAI